MNDNPGTSTEPTADPGMDPVLGSARSSWPGGEVLELRGVVVRRGGRPILDHVDLSFEPGRRHVIVGPSGAGKSTLLRLLNRLEDPDEGVVLLGGRPLSDFPALEVRRRVGLVFQNSRALPGTVRENLAYPWRIRGLATPSDVRLAGALEDVGLDPSWLERDTGGLSGGERQRLAMITALSSGPEFLALDEPTSGLDPESAVRVARFLERLAGEGLRTITVTHHREHAMWLGDHGVHLRAGRVVEEGPLVQVLQRADDGSWSRELEERAEVAS